ncbi:2'-5' RNA ligase family protein [Dyadobacter sp. CY356]|uniref:2'-5' RNA ligase family protein n=1 Tax=Dyadobacter sp. CY356 TaxID=2906442 RepID=UPI001F2CFD34|nr:2'-5' RNA ligase family protein [Dyadobacter sp. CY356]MCF0056041.1 2'-5' RNA ligase family protein [Dyadobacter sp. CY356]
MRRQLTLFLTNQKDEIEKIRSEFNPVQFELIAAHITLCRENEIEELDKIIGNIRTISFSKPLQMEFEPVERFEKGKGLLIPAKIGNSDFLELRTTILAGTGEFNRNYLPHITLMHPRNSICTDKIFDQIKKYKLPSIINFDTISLIEQTGDGVWKIIQQFPIFNPNN